MNFSLVPAYNWRDQKTMKQMWILPCFCRSLHSSIKTPRNSIMPLPLEDCPWNAKICLIFRQCSILRGVSLFYFFRASRLQSVGWVFVDAEHQEWYKNTVRWVADRLQFLNQWSDLPPNEVMGWVRPKNISAVDWEAFNTLGSSLRKKQVSFHCKWH